MFYGTPGFLVVLLLDRSILQLEIMANSGVGIEASHDTYLNLPLIDIRRLLIVSWRFILMARNGKTYEIADHNLALAFCSNCWR